MAYVDARIKHYFSVCLETETFEIESMLKVLEPPNNIEAL